MSEPASELTIGQVAERTGLSVHALRFYEREGILAQPVRRDPGGRRVYAEGDVDWLTVCIVLRGSGMPVPTIRRYTELVRQGAGTEAERLDLMRQHREQVLRQMAQRGATIARLPPAPGAEDATALLRSGRPNPGNYARR